MVLAREAGRLTQQQVSDRWGRKQSIYAKIETCERRIDLIEFAVLSSIVGLDAVETLRAVIIDMTSEGELPL